MWPHNRKENSYTEDLWGLQNLTHSRAHAHTLLQGGKRERGGGLGAGASHLCFSLLQEGLEPLLSGPPLVVVTHYQDDVVPVELPHQVEPHVRLVGIGRDCPQKGQVDTLRSTKQEIEINIVELTVFQQQLNFLCVNHRSEHVGKRGQKAATRADSCPFKDYFLGFFDL